MHRGRILNLAAIAALTVATAAAVVPATVGASAHSAKGSAAVCGPAAAGFARCNVRGVTIDGHPSGAASSPQGYGPADLQSAYNLPSSTGGSGQTVAVVDAYDDPNAASDLATYRSTFGLPACGQGCFTKVNQVGGTRYPKANAGWAVEISLDIDMVSAVCPNCHILLVEATSASLGNLLTAEDWATGHANYVSNSWGGGEFSSETSSDSHFNKAGRVITASSGDSGFGAQWPASSQYVVSVGGTTLTSQGGAFSESAWSGAGSGCSALEPQPSWQSHVSNITANCSQRAVADVSAVADPNTGVSVYDTIPYQGMSGWEVWGGTSVASPLIAAAYALTGRTDSASVLYSHIGSTALHDVTSGSNGSCGNALCNATAGWDGPTGAGTPNGVAAL